jgi:ferredoxin, 2Fe-2S
VTSASPATGPQLNTGLCREAGTRASCGPGGGQAEGQRDGMPIVTFILGGARHTFDVDLASMPYGHHGLPGSLLDVALNVGVPLEHVCGGNCACTTCHVIVTAGATHLSELSDDEADRLDTAWDVTPRSRLACQAVVTGDVECEIPAYTRNYVEEGGLIRLGRQA